MAILKLLSNFKSIILALRKRDLAVYLLVDILFVIISVKPEWTTSGFPCKSLYITNRTSSDKPPIINPVVTAKTNPRDSQAINHMQFDYKNKAPS